ncbi:MAG: LamG-like jellyroll fold domain-containing protein [Acidobacteriota bacterium]
MKLLQRLFPLGLSALALIASLLVSVPARAQAPAAALHTQIWRFNRLDRIGGFPTEVVGHPQIIRTPYGKAVHFNGINDALVVPDHPLAGASTYTWEVIFRPDAGGMQAQRFFHLQEQDPVTHADTGNRMLFELRVVDGQWCLDSFASSGKNSRALLNCKLLHPLGRWYRITAVYDGKMLRNYVGGELQGEGSLDFKPQMQGHSSVGVRINKVNWFQGDILMARMTPRALNPGEFLKMPKKVVALDK